MKYVIDNSGMEDATAVFERLGKYAEWAAKNALYQGAGLLADKVNRGIMAIPAQRFKWASTRRGETRNPSVEEKAILMEAGVGISKFEGTGSEWETTVSIKEGYWMLGKKPIAARKIAAAINTGTSFRTKQPFYRKAVTLARKQVEQRMVDTLSACLDAIVNGQQMEGNEGGTSK